MFLKKKKKKVDIYYDFVWVWSFLLENIIMELSKENMMWHDSWKIFGPNIFGALGFNSQ